MSKSSIKKEITKKLKDKWGYSEQQIVVYWKLKNDMSVDELLIELENI